MVEIKNRSRALRRQFHGKVHGFGAIGDFLLTFGGRTFHTSFDEDEDVDEHWVLVYFRSGWIVSTVQSLTIPLVGPVPLFSDRLSFPGLIQPSI